MDDNSLKNLVMIADISFGRFCFQTLGAVDFIGRKVFRPIYCDKILSHEKLILEKLLSALQVIQKSWENILKLLGWDRIKNISHLGIFRNRFDAEDSGKVVALSSFLQSSLEAQDGRILEKHHDKSAHQEIMQAMFNLYTLALIADLPKAFGHYVLQSGEAQVLFYVH